MRRSIWQTLVMLFLTAAVQGASPIPPAGPVQITVHADQVVGQVSRYLTGACIEDVNHEIYGGLYSQMIFGESFQEPPPVSTIPGFMAYGGRWMVRDGEVAISGLDGPKLVSNHGAFQDGAVGVEVFFADRQGDNAGLIVCVAQPGVGADRFSGYEVSLSAARQSLRLGRHRNNYTLLKDVPCAVAPGRWIPLEVRLTGSILEILVEGKSVLRHDDGPAALPAGTVGLRAWQQAARYRNLWVKTGDQRESLAWATAEPTAEVSGMWRPLRQGAAEGHYALDAQRPFVGAQAQQMSFDSGTGQWGVENQGLNRWGLNFVAGQPYEGCLWVRAEKAATLFAALESRDGSQVYAEESLPVAAGDWQRLELALTPHAADSAGRLALKLKQPGSVTLGYAFLQPGAWGRFKDLPVRRDVAQGLIAAGITVLRYGGSMVNNDGYKWKNMIGPRDRRQPYAGLWYRYSSNGWGIPDFMNFAEAAGMAYVPDFNSYETPQDMADFIDYAKGSAESPWGHRRAADGHPAPYQLKYLELGNEERVDDAYAARFAALAEAIWAKDQEIILVVGDFAYARPITNPFGFTGADSGITTLAAHRRILQLARQHQREVWFDVHVNTEHPVACNTTLVGLFSLADALDQIAAGAAHKVVVFELNAGNHAQKRALANALAINAIERDGRLPMVCSANGLQPDGQNDNGWDQGLLFLNPAQVWLQPPGYVAQMFSENYQPQRLACPVTGPAGPLDINAKRSADGATLELQAVNPGDQAVAAQIHLAGFVPRQPLAQRTTLAGPMENRNTAEKTDTMIPERNMWEHRLKDGSTQYTFPAHSFTMLRFE